MHHGPARHGECDLNNLQTRVAFTASAAGPSVCVCGVGVGVGGGHSDQGPTGSPASDVCVCAHLWRWHFQRRSLCVLLGHVRRSVPPSAPTGPNLAGADAGNERALQRAAAAVHQPPCTTFVTGWARRRSGKHCPRTSLAPTHPNLPHHRRRQQCLSLLIALTALTTPSTRPEPAAQIAQWTAPMGPLLPLTSPHPRPP